MPNLEGQVLRDRYRIEELIGRGGMAEVYKAWDLRRQHHVAIKVMREDMAGDLEFLRRFKREAEALSALSHENIVRFYSFERTGPLAFIVMDYVQGTTLQQRILQADGRPLPLAEVLPIVQQVCAALHYAHRENVLHRDVKPGNIMLRTDGRVLVADFGIAKAADSATVTTVMPGTPAYMSPEQCRSEPLDVRADVYSLGIVVYEMLAGRRPFVGETQATTGSTREKIRWEQMHVDPPPLARFSRRVPRGVEVAVRIALAKEPDARWPTVQDFWEVIAEGSGVPERDWVVSPVSVRREPELVAPRQRVSAPPLVVPRPRPAPAADHQPAGRVKIPPWGWAVTGVMFVALLLVVLGVLFGGRATPEPEVIVETVVVERDVTVAPPVETVEPTETPVVIPSDTATSTPSPTPSRTPTPTLTPTRTPEPRASAEQAVRDYYSLINSGQYDRTWAMLSDHFKDIFNCCRADGSYDYPGYVDWWASVRQVQIGTVSLVEQSGDWAHVYANLSYLLNDGRLVNDTRPHIYLVWDYTDNGWAFNDKTQ